MSWSKTFGRSFGDYGHSVEQTSDGGYVVAGCAFTDYVSQDDVCMVRVDSSGQEIWYKTLGGPSSDEGNSVKQTSDGGYVIVGHTFSYGTDDRDVWLIKTDANGDTLWTRTFGGVNPDGGTSVQQTSDGGYIIAGYACSFGAGDVDVWLIKTDDHGDTLWTRAFGGASADNGAAVQQTSDGGYIIAGSTCSLGAGDADVWLIKTDNHGDTLWTRAFGGASAENGAAVQQTSDGGYILAGSTESYGAGDRDVWLLKTDASGNKVWTRRSAGPT
jgi:regulation of enolase protein 1 (concanavalin A-like superfamily)